MGDNMLTCTEIHHSLRLSPSSR